MRWNGNGDVHALPERAKCEAMMTAWRRFRVLGLEECRAKSGSN